MATARRVARNRAAIVFIPVIPVVKSLLRQPYLVVVVRWQRHRRGNMPLSGCVMMVIGGLCGAWVLLLVMVYYSCEEIVGENHRMCQTRLSERVVGKPPIATVGVLDDNAAKCYP